MNITGQNLTKGSITEPAGMRQDNPRELKEN